MATNHVIQIFIDSVIPTSQSAHLNDTIQWTLPGAKSGSATGARITFTGANPLEGFTGTLNLANGSPSSSYTIQSDASLEKYSYEVATLYEGGAVGTVNATLQVVAADTSTDGD